MSSTIYNTDCDYSTLYSSSIKISSLPNKDDVKLREDGLTLVKNLSNMRSGIYDSEGILCSFSPLSSSKDESLFFNDRNELLPSTYIQEYVEGTMINMFYYNETWNIATKGNIGGNNKFFKDNTRISKSFKDMFNEVLDSLNISYNIFNKNICYSFVMKHIDNRIINPVLNNQLYLINCYETTNYPFQDSLFMIFPKEHLEYLREHGIKLPSVIPHLNNGSLGNKDMILDLFCSPKTPYEIMGVNLLNIETGQRMKFRNPNFEELKRLRGNQAKMEFHYLELRNNDKIIEFLDFFPEYKNEFMMYESKIMDFGHTLFSNYSDCYLMKKAPLREYSLKYRNHMFEIHQQYQKNKQKTTFDIVMKYLETVPEPVLLASLNYEYRTPKVKQENNSDIDSNEDSNEDIIEKALVKAVSVDDMSLPIEEHHDEEQVEHHDEEHVEHKKKKHHGGVKHGKGKHHRIHELEHQMKNKEEEL